MDISMIWLHQPLDISQLEERFISQIANFIVENGGNCRPFIAPVDVQLDCDEKTMVQPDVGIVCDSSKIQRFGVYGAPDFLVEVISPSTKKKDYTLKLIQVY